MAGLVLKPEESAMCPWCGGIPTSESVPASELVRNLQSDEYITYWCQTCGLPFSAEEDFHGNVKIKKVYETSWRD
jgi:hypothetical protein